MVRGTSSRMLFIDSSVTTHHDRCKISLPPHPFSAVGSERVAFSLQQFSIRRNWYNINETNNTGYIYVASTHHEFRITPGAYASFTALSTALASALNAAATTIAKITSFAVTHDPTSRQFVITVTMAGSHTDTVGIRCFFVKPGDVLPSGVTLAGGSSDLYEILGGRPLRSGVDDFDSVTNETGVGATQILKSRYPASLNTLDAIYLHMTAFETGNFMSTGHESQVADSQNMIESSLFARIPFARSAFDEVHEVVQYTDAGNDVFQSFPLRKNFEQLELRVCDARGRSLAQLSPQQADDGLMSWKAVVRYDLFRPPPAPPIEGAPPTAFSHHGCPPKL